jgi:hypothetical protein
LNGQNHKARLDLEHGWFSGRNHASAEFDKKIAHPSDPVWSASLTYAGLLFFGIFLAISAIKGRLK